MQEGYANCEEAWSAQVVLCVKENVPFEREVEPRGVYRGGWEHLDRVGAAVAPWRAQELGAAHAGTVGSELVSIDPHLLGAAGALAARGREGVEQRRADEAWRDGRLRLTLGEIKAGTVARGALGRGRHVREADVATRWGEERNRGRHFVWF